MPVVILFVYCPGIFRRPHCLRGTDGADCGRMHSEFGLLLKALQMNSSMGLYVL
jgi:hypothetical protein